MGIEASFSSRPSPAASGKDANGTRAANIVGRRIASPQLAVPPLEIPNTVTRFGSTGFSARTLSITRPTASIGSALSYFSRLFLDSLTQLSHLPSGAFGH